MPELRHDPLQKRWIIIATERAMRPTDFEVCEEPQKENTCPFCEGNESMTPPEILAYRDEGTQPNEPGWTVRVISNKFPALRIDGDLDRRGLGLYDAMNGVGAHEVIIETTEHTLTTADFDHDQMIRVLTIYRDRIADLKKDDRFRYILIFKNHGEAAGASLSHSHTQLIATPVTPRTVAIELETSKEHYREKERCLMCDLIQQETVFPDRIIRDDGHYVILSPFASRFPFECWVVPKVHKHAFETTTDEELSFLAETMKDILSRLKICLNDPPYNFILHTSPNTEAKPKRPMYWQTVEFDYHWHFEIIPRLTRVAGFEWGSGFYINPMPPEEAARYLSQAAPKSS
ncbi:MAG: galactose-1-phosphate uridylyltransferase [Gemmatimonadota bacterium]|nr:MAG: galactose-1-phosphate uridylyltransferase [Gemmatimonadota bacterium]